MQKPVRHFHDRRSKMSVADMTLIEEQLKSLEDRDAAVSKLREPGVVQQLTFDKAGCRIVQAALEVADRKTARLLVEDLRGCARDAIKSPHGNYVIQKAIEKLTAEASGFLVEELLGNGSNIARHVYGCRILCRICEHYASDEKTVQLIDEVVQDAAELAYHRYAHHVLESALEYGLPRQITCIMQALLIDLNQCVNSTARYVLEKALLFCDESEKHFLISQIVSSNDRLLAMSTNQHGSSILQILVQIPGDHINHLKTLFLESGHALHKCKYGRRLLESIKQRCGQ